MYNCYAPQGWFYNTRGNLHPHHLDGKGEAYAPEGYSYTKRGELKRNGKARWEEAEMKETNSYDHRKHRRKATELA